MRDAFGYAGRLVCGYALLDLGRYALAVKQKHYTALISRDGAVCVALCPELDVASQQEISARSMVRV
jgi:hypothetical protein